MILTVTMNPSIDMSYPLDKLNINTTNRVRSVSKTAGGKGLNVTRILHRFNLPVTATGLLGGDHGNFIKHRLDSENISHSFSSINGETRNSIALLHDSKQTEILEPGPEITHKEMETFLENLDSLLSDTQIITILGSLPKGLSKKFYTQLIQKAENENIRTLLDTSGETLRKSLEGDSKPFLIKPNEEELVELVKENIDLSDTNKIKNILNKDLFNGIEWIVLTLGKNGALVKHHNSFYKVNIPAIDVVNPVGSGDATIAGLAKGFFENNDVETIIKTGMTTGMLNTLESTTGHIDTSKFNDLMDVVEVIQI